MTTVHRQSPLVILPVEELLTRVYPTIPTLISDAVLVRGSLNVLGGPPKIGKSLLTLNLALSVSSGAPWLGFETQQARVLVIQAEVPEQQLQERLLFMQDGAPAWPVEGQLWFLTHRGLLLDRQDGHRTLQRLMLEYQPELVIIDPLARFFSGDENSSQAVGALVRSLDTLIQDFGVSILLVHHTTKPSQDPRSGGDKLRGSGALFGAVDSALMFQAMRKDWRLEFELRHGKPLDPMTVYQETDTLWFTSGVDPRLAAVRALVLAQPMTWKALCSALVSTGISDPTAQRRIKSAIEAGLVKREKSGLYATHQNHQGHQTPVMVNSTTEKQKKIVVGHFQSHHQIFPSQPSTIAPYIEGAWNDGDGGALENDPETYPDEPNEDPF